MAEAADPAKLRRLRRLAYRELGIAIDKAGGELSGDWLKQDPDLEAIRDESDPDWRLLVMRATGKPTADDLRLPEPARGDPHRRSRQWWGIAAIWALAAVGVVVLGILFGWSELAVAAAALTAIAALLSASYALHLRTAAELADEQAEAAQKIEAGRASEEESRPAAKAR